MAEKAQTVWRIQEEIAEKVISVNQTLALIEGGLLNITPTEKSVEELNAFLQRLLELETIFFIELSEEYPEIVDAIELYRRDKEAYARKYPALIYVVYMKGSTKIPERKFHTSLEEVDEFLRERGEWYEIGVMRIYPATGVMISLARAILNISLKKDLLRLARERRPRRLFDGGVLNEFAGILSSE